MLQVRYYGSKMPAEELVLTRVVDLCEVVANFRLSSNVPGPLFQNQSDRFKNLTCNIKMHYNYLLM